MMFQIASGWFINNTAILANTYVTNATRGLADCEFAAFDDPMDEILNGFRELALRMGVAAAAEGTKSQTAAYTTELTSTVYAAHRGNLALAVVISLLGPVATLILFWGWWGLGRSFSLSPLEIANAFYSGGGASELAATTALVGASSNASAEQVAKHVRKGGDPVVRYGVSKEEKRLVVAVGDSEGVKTPRSGEILR